MIKKKKTGDLKKKNSLSNLTITSCQSGWSFCCVLKVPPIASSTPVQRVEPTVISSVHPQVSSNVGPKSCYPPPSPQPAVITARPTTQTNIIPCSRNESIGLNVADFLLVSLQKWKKKLNRQTKLKDIKLNVFFVISFAPTTNGRPWLMMRLCLKSRKVMTPCV